MVNKLMASKKPIVPTGKIEQRILMIRGEKVIIDADLAEFYGVPTKRLNEQVKRNKNRFPEDFMFRLKKSERNELVTNCDRFRTLKHSSSNPYAFTEQGVAMLSSVLKSERAVQVNIVIMRAFVTLREIISTHKELAGKVDLIENRLYSQDKKIYSIFEAIRQLMNPPVTKRSRIGFKGKKNEEL